MSSQSPLDDIAAAAAAPVDAPDLRRGQEPDAADGFDVADLGDNCPVQPLGFLKQKHYFLDFAGQLIELGTEFRKGEVMALFGTKMKWLEWKWPRHKEVTDKKTGEKEWIVDGFDQVKCQKAMIAASSKSGLFDPTNKVRGRGAHRGPDGELVLHCGDTVLTGGKRGARRNILKSVWAKPGLIGGFVYPTAPALVKPDERPAPVLLGEQVRETLETWNWKRGAIDAHLLLCWVAAALIGGALRHRPHVWITGPSGAGKTTLQDFLRRLIDDWGVFTEDATEAGVRQLLNQDTLAVMFDEIEPDEANAEVHLKIVKLARLAYSGSSSLRGGQDHQSKRFVARSCFLFSSIHHHELPAQDRNRMAVLHLSKFPAKTAPLKLPAELKAWGAALRRRLVEQWARFDDTLLEYQREMLAQGYSGREQDTYGTLLAAGDLLLHDMTPGDAVEASGRDRCAELVEQLGQVLDSARAEAEDTTERCLKYLASHRLASASGQHQETVGRWLAKAYIAVHNGGAAFEARQKLKTHGLKLVNLRRGHEGTQAGLTDAYLPDAVFVAIAGKTNKGMAEIFEKSAWQKGVWSQALALVGGAFVDKKARFDGPTESCIVVPLEELIDVDAARIEAIERRNADAAGS